MNNVININPSDSTPDLEQQGEEIAFNHQHFIAEGMTGLLFHITSEKENRYIPDSVLTSATYAIQCAVHDINICFQTLLSAKGTLL